MSKSQKVLVDWDWLSRDDVQRLTHQDKIVLCCIEANEVYRNTGDTIISDSEYDYLFDMIEDSELKLSVGTALGSNFTPEYLRKPTIIDEPLQKEQETLDMSLIEDILAKSKALLTKGT